MDYEDADVMERIMKWGGGDRKVLKFPSSLQSVILIPRTQEQFLKLSGLVYVSATHILE